MLGKFAVDVYRVGYLASESGADNPYACTYGSIPPPMSLMYDTARRHSDSTGVGESPITPAEVSADKLGSGKRRCGVRRGE